MKTEAMKETMANLNAALGPLGMSATFTPDPEVEDWGRIDFAGETEKHRMTLHFAGASFEPGPGKTRLAYRDQHVMNLRDFAYEVIRQLPKN